MLTKFVYVIEILTVLFYGVTVLDTDACIPLLSMRWEIYVNPRNLRKGEYMHIIVDVLAI